jgi:hypothetical protein
MIVREQDCQTGGAHQDELREGMSHAASPDTEVQLALGDRDRNRLGAIDLDQ